MAAVGSVSGKSVSFIARIGISVYTVVISLGSGCSLDWTSMVNTEPTAEKRPGLGFSTEGENQTAHEDESSSYFLVHSLSFSMGRRLLQCGVGVAGG